MLNGYVQAAYDESSFLPRTAMFTHARTTAVPACRRTNRTLFFGGFACFPLLYCVQPLQPLLAHDFFLKSRYRRSPREAIASARLDASLHTPECCR
jgi:hypothetical protein